jgi:hypothetical protein
MVQSLVPAARAGEAGTRSALAKSALINKLRVFFNFLTSQTPDIEGFLGLTINSENQLFRALTEDSQCSTRVAVWAKRAQPRRPHMAQKSPQKNSAKTAPAKNLKEKRLEKKAKSEAKDKRQE